MFSLVFFVIPRATNVAQPLDPRTSGLWYLYKKSALFFLIIYSLWLCATTMRSNLICFRVLKLVFLMESPMCSECMVAFFSPLDNLVCSSHRVSTYLSSCSLTYGGIHQKEKRKLSCIFLISLFLISFWFVAIPPQPWREVTIKCIITWPLHIK